jgi:hypothetical protein
MSCMQRESLSGGRRTHANFFVSGLSRTNSDFSFILLDTTDNGLGSRAVHCLRCWAGQILVGDVVVDTIDSDLNPLMASNRQVFASPKACSVCSRPQPLSGSRSWAEVSAVWRVGRWPPELGRTTCSSAIVQNASTSPSVSENHSP